MTSTSLIFVVDDQADYCFILQQLFGRHCLTSPVRFFAGGKALLEELARVQHQPSLILLDRHMPGLDGYQTLLALKSQPAYTKIPVVMISSEVSPPEINECYEAGAHSFLRKPLDLPATKVMVEAICHDWIETNQRLLSG
ncbi:response regulator [Spirosoma jeollabukense]